MKGKIAIGIVLLITASNALAADVDEQTRRCNMEKSSLTNPSHREGAECMKLRAMLNLPEPTQINIKNYYHGDDDRRTGGRNCTVSGDTAYCD